jgi:chromosome segregation ATPase
MSDAELIARLRLYGSKFHHEFGHNDDAADRIEALTEQLAAARQDAKFAEDELEMQEQEACMMENDYTKLEKERDALEAKLAKAVEALEYYAVEASLWDRATSRQARATLAEIKGGNDAKSDL